MIGMNNYLYQTQSKTLFDLLTLPEGIDKDTVVENILLEGGEFECLYSDPEFLRDAINMWGRKHYYTFEKWITAMNIEYNPLENYDRIEDWTDTSNKGVNSSARRDSGNTRTFNNQDQRTLNTSDAETLNTQNQRTLNTTDTAETTVSAYDSSSYQPSEKITTSDTGTDTMNNTGTNTTNHTGTDTMNYTGTIKDEYGEGTSGLTTENGKQIHGGRIHGNIGVTTSQQMLQQEYDIARFNIVEQITDLFLLEFCIMVYD